MPERTVRANGIEIWCEDFGRRSDPTLLLVMGAGGQGILWPDEFCRELASAGRYVIRYDNRDTGQSTCVDFAKQPYTVSDMARDGIELLDALGVERAHVAGASMGGMIAQTLAIEHGARVRTLTSIMSTPLAGSELMGTFAGQPGPLPGPEPKVLELFAKQAANPPRTRDERIAASTEMWRVLSGSASGSFDEASVRARAARVFARARNPDAAQNHQLAIAASADRLDGLRKLAIPTLVIHGDEDPILPPPHGRATADAIPGARFLSIHGMGHDLGPAHTKRVAEALLEHTAR